MSGAGDLRAYRTVREPAEVVFDVKGSQFIGRAAPVASVEDAKAFIARVAAAHADASHNVPAYRVRAAPVAEWTSDEGEPSGTAGRPMLNVLQQQDIVDVVVVATRYFGGTKLGAGGLVRAYSRAAREAVAAAGVVEREPEVAVTVTVAYEDVGAVTGVLEAAGHPFTVAYGARVRFTVRANASAAPALRDRVQSATRGRAHVT